ncbi:glycosyl hydrolase 108 family protein [Kamptonema sp. UHCC 0994]|uniref:glycosyl hydrolase 108 family protein n=1 Tax=Kamptonema sp. UHCC 0994 TaxID=3031329 RepID=UPI0023B9824F|nr:glycosyl hydrolase 108 family protein [Kamptonema sp. UHCC 0994]MDF0552189.1 glycosyl hydrolase 108 family protein [Kamptonema sp. UHCC 0994]
MKEARIEEIEMPLDYSIWQTVLLLAIAGCVIAPGWIVDGSKRAINAIVPGAHLQVDPEPLQINNAGGLVSAAAAAIPQNNSADGGTNFDKAFAFARKWEGGYANVAGDAGGKTYGGITEATARRNGISDPRQLTGNEGRIKEIYRKDYWDNAKCDRFKTIIGATTCLDTAINYGSAFLRYNFFSKCPESRLFRTYYAKILVNNWYQS